MATQVTEQYRQLFEQAQSVLRDRNDVNRIRIQIGSATCENAAGAGQVLTEFRKQVQASGRTDIMLRQVGCTGRCSCEPIVGVLVPGHMPVFYERVDRELVSTIFTTHVLGGHPVAEHLLDSSLGVLSQYELLFCSGTRCGRHVEQDFRQVFQDKLRKAGLAERQVHIVTANCFGLCQQEHVGKATHILVKPTKVIYRVTADKDLDDIISEHLIAGRIVDRLRVEDRPMSERFFELYGDVAFFNRQSRVALRNSGIVDPANVYEYINFNGFESLARVLDRKDPQSVIDEITQSKLRGRGGGGYPTGLKWSQAAQEKETVRYIICNADEGDPGAFMDRSMLEGDPFSVIEGMIIGGFAIGASQGFLYIRAEYPMAIERIENAIRQSRQIGILGQNILGSGFSFDLEIRLGAGAFVCGEETALIHSIEGRRGQPTLRPPYPAQSGLWGKPTIINNVETWANVPVIIRYGADWFSQLGTPKSGGTKVFALTGKVRHTGLVEVPMGTTLREIVNEIGGGVPEGRKLKAIQTGGPAGGVIPESLLDTIVDFDSLNAVGAIMGSGGMIVMSDDDCMVDIAKFFLTFSQSESCGKCTPCREGTTRMLEILERITSGQGTLEDIRKLERLSKLLCKASLCGLGRVAANPVLSTLRHFRDEYLAHVEKKRCPAKTCTALIHYEINSERCVGCTACARVCPVTCISGRPKVTHVIDQSRCIKCGQCFQTCRFGAVDRL